MRSLDVDDYHSLEPEYRFLPMLRESWSAGAFGRIWKQSRQSQIASITAVGRLESRKDLQT